MQIVFHRICDGCRPYSTPEPVFTAFLDWLATRVANGTVMVKMVQQVMDDYWAFDKVPPDTSITSAPSQLAADAPANFEFSASEEASSFDCQLDEKAWEPCYSPASYTNLAQAVHSFAVRATDRGRNTDPSPARHEFTVDTPPPGGDGANRLAFVRSSEGRLSALVECLLVRLRERLPQFVAPMLVTPAAAPPAEPGWALEVKWDGIRAQALWDRGRLTVRSRRGRDCTAEFPELADPLPVAASGRTLLLDGELVCFNDEGRPDFGLLRARLGCCARSARAHAARSPVTLMVFDVLHVDGHAVRRLPYQRRRELLAELELCSRRWQTPTAFDGDADLVAATRACGLEGVVAKRLDAAYGGAPVAGLAQDQEHAHRDARGRGLGARARRA